MTRITTRGWDWKGVETGLHTYYHICVFLSVVLFCFGKSLFAVFCFVCLFVILHQVTREKNCQLAKREEIDTTNWRFGSSTSGVPPVK